MNNVFVEQQGLTTTDICRYYKSGEIDCIPEEHINKIMNRFFARLKRGMSEEDTLKSRNNCIKKYRHDQNLMATRYLDIMYKLNEHTKNLIRKTGNKHNEQCKAYQQKRKLKTNDDNTHETINDRLTEYYDVLAIYSLGSLVYQNQTINIYRDIPIQYMHNTITSLHTDKHNQYYFKSEKFILPTEELINLCLVKFNILKLD